MCPLAGAVHWLVLWGQVLLARSHIMSERRPLARMRHPNISHMFTSSYMSSLALLTGHCGVPVGQLWHTLWVLATASCRPPGAPAEISISRDKSMYERDRECSPVGDRKRWRTGVREERRGISNYAKYIGYKYTRLRHCSGRRSSGQRSPWDGARKRHSGLSPRIHMSSCSRAAPPSQHAGARAPIRTIAHHAHTLAASAIRLHRDTT